MIDRKNWVSALSALPIDDLVSMTNELSADWQVKPLAPPQSGLGVLKLNDSAFGETFYLGEFPISTARLQVITGDGEEAEGAAQLMDDRVEFVQALALCDAILSKHLAGWEQVEKLIEKGMMIRQSTCLERKRMLAHTQVNFSLLDDMEVADVSA